MKIKASETFFMLNLPEFIKGNVYDVTDEVGLVLLERNLVERVREKEVAPAKLPKKKELNNEE